MAFESLDVASLTAEWAAIPSPTGHEAHVLRTVEAALEAMGWETHRIAVSGDRFDVLAGPSSGAVVFTTHLDVVPPHIEPRLEGRVLWGRGVADAKGAAAAMTVAANRLRREGLEVSLLFVVGEETDSEGAQAAVAAGLLFDYVVNGEPTENTFASFQKGTLRVTLRTRGLPCHSGYPHMGVSAVDRMLDVLGAVRSTAWPTTPSRGATTLNIGRIEGGVADNVLAPEATARLMFRTIGPAEEVLDLLAQAVRGEAEIEPGKISDPLELYVPPGRPSGPVSFGSDLPYLRAIGVPLMVGPGSILTAHGPDERVPVEELERAVELYTEIGRAACVGSL